MYICIPICKIVTHTNTPLNTLPGREKHSYVYINTEILKIQVATQITVYNYYKAAYSGFPCDVALGDQENIYRCMCM